MQAVHVHQRTRLVACFAFHADNRREKPWPTSLMLSLGQRKPRRCAPPGDVVGMRGLSPSGYAYTIKINPLPVVTLCYQITNQASGPNLVEYTAPPGGTSPKTGAIKAMNGGGSKRNTKIARAVYETWPLISTSKGTGPRFLPSLSGETPAE